MFGSHGNKKSTLNRNLKKYFIVMLNISFSLIRDNSDNLMMNRCAVNYFCGSKNWYDLSIA